jgi:general secretion pathway protein A
LLSNLETATRKLLQIILVGQPELARKLDLPELQPLKQCIALRATLSPLTPQDSLAYIQHRLAKVALAQAPIFTVGALKRIVAHAQGVPRLLNILCDNALIAGFASQQRPVSAKLVQEVIADLEGAPATVSSPAATSPWKPTLALACVLLGVLGVFSYRNFSVPTWLRQDLPQAHTPVSTGHDGQDKEPVLTAAPAPQAIGQETEKPRAADSQVPAPPPQAKIEVQPAAPPVKTPEPPAKTPEPPAKAPEPPVPLETTFPVTRVVKPGDSLSKLIASVYGASSNDLVEWVKAHNPRIQDTNVIVVGERIVFPEFNEAAKKELRERRRRAEKDNEEPF